MNATPDKDPADEGTLQGMLRATFRKLLQGVDGMLPAVVLNYDRASNRATVRPMVSLLMTTGEVLQRAAVASVPVLAHGAGGFVITYPVKAGDLGWLEASDRDISLFMQALRESQPNTTRMHSFEDARFIPDAFRGYTLPSGTNAADDMTIQSLDGSVAVVLKPGAVVVRAPAVSIEATGTITLQAGAGVTIQGQDWATHQHSGVDTGPGNTGGVV